jgi:hypothetical protein
MTAARQQRKPLGDARGLWLTAGLLLAFAMPAPAASVIADNGPVEVNAYTGLAISGFDPVAYFTEGRALVGKGEFEQSFAGAVWRFRNDGNRAAFVAAPDVYMPRFGGYDPVGVARGVAVAGNPLLWIISRERLYLFYAAETRKEFADDSDRIIATADREWPSINRRLVP